MGASCVECGGKISAGLGRLAKNKMRLCASCHAKPGVGPRRPIAIGERRDCSTGYVVIKTKNGWELEHRVVMRQVLGRDLLTSEVVHHLDQNKKNNSPSNLVVETGIRQHLDRYHKKQLVPPPTHHFGKRKWTTREYEIFNGKLA
jgi:hypothetical protein